MRRRRLRLGKLMLAVVLTGLTSTAWAVEARDPSTRRYQDRDGALHTTRLAPLYLVTLRDGNMIEAAQVKSSKDGYVLLLLNGRKLLLPRRQVWMVKYGYLRLEEECQRGRYSHAGKDLQRERGVRSGDRFAEWRHFGGAGHASDYYGNYHWVPR